MNKTKFGLLAVVGAGAAALTVASLAGADRPVTVAQAAPARPPVAAPARPAVDPHAGHAHAAPTPPAAMPSGPAGKVEVPVLIHDVGNVERGVEIKYDFQIKNVGQHDLTVDAKPG